MRQDYETYSCLDNTLQSLICELHDEVFAQRQQQGEGVWQAVPSLLKAKFVNYDFSQCLKDFPINKTYARIPYMQTEALSVVLFIFNNEQNDNYAALIHVYGHAFPNDVIYSWDRVISPVNKLGRFIKQTPPHSHRTQCVSYVAHLSDNVSITEENYALQSDGMLQQRGQKARACKSISIDPGKGDIIHSISVHFH